MIGVLTGSLLDKSTAERSSAKAFSIFMNLRASGLGMNNKLAVKSNITNNKLVSPFEEVSCIDFDEMASKISVCCQEVGSSKTFLWGDNPDSTWYLRFWQIKGGGTPYLSVPLELFETLETFETPAKSGSRLFFRLLKTF